MYTPKTAHPVGEQWRWQRLQILDDRGVLSIAETQSSIKERVMWFGLFHGLLSYDGYEWREHETLKGQRIIGLFGASNGVLYVRAEYGIYKYQNEAWSQISSKARVLNDITPIIESVDGSIWFVEDSGLLQYYQNRIITHTFEGRRFSDIQTLKDGNIWLVEHDSGDLFRYSVEKESINLASELHIKYPEKHYLIRRNVYQISLAKDCVWHSNLKRAIPLRCFDLNTNQWRSIDKSEFRASNYHSGTLIGNDDELIIWGPNFIAVNDDSGWHTFKTPEYDLPHTPFRVFQASDNSLWVGGKNPKAMYIRSNFKHWRDSYLNLLFQIEYPEGYRWFISSDDKVIVQQVETDRWLQFDDQENFIRGPHAILNSANGTVWVVGEHFGDAALTYTDGQQFIDYFFNNGSDKPKVTSDIHASVGAHFSRLASFINDKNELIIGSDSTLNRVGGALIYSPLNESSSEYQFIYLQPPEVNPRTSSIAQRRDKSLFVTAGPDLHINQGKKNFTHKPIPPQMRNQGKSTQVITDNKDNIWLANTRDGIYKFDGKEWFQFTQADGLPSRPAFHLLQLEDESIMAVTDEGISRFDGRNWSDSFNRKIPILRGDTEVREGSNGNIWLNLNYKYLNHINDLDSSERDFYTTQYYFDDTPPETKIEFYNDEVRQGRYTAIQWSAFDPWFQTDDSLMRYSYKLNDNDWSPFYRDKQVILEGLEKGKHILLVRARDADFNIDPTPAEVRFAVVLPLWRQAWFQLLIVLTISVFVIGIIFIFRMREKHIRDIESLKINFLTGVSHELRTPLTLIQGPVEQIILSSSDKDLKNKLRVVQRNAKRLMALVDQLLDFRRIESGQVKLNLTRLELISFTQTVVEQMKILAKDKHIQIDEKYSEIEYFCQWDADKHEKIINNLLSNAIKYTPDHGCVSISLNIKNNIKPILEIVIEDNGIGIAKNDQKNIFNQFYRVDVEGNASKGSGVGLAYTKELVELFSGKIEVQSPINFDNLHNDSGCRFTIVLPLNERLADLAGGFDKTQKNGFPKVLVVDDDKEIALFVKDILDNSFRVDLAVDGQAALEYTKTDLPDLIITDLMMPVMDGKALCEAIKENELTAHIPVILLTARGSQESEIDLLKSGADDYIKKPFQVDILINRVKNLIESRKALRQKFSGKVIASPSEVTSNKTDEAFLQRAIAVVQENLSDSDFSVIDFAKQMKMSRQNLYMKLKALTDQSAQDFIRTLRLEQGRKLLLEGSESSIADIAIKVGFEDPNYFSRRFKIQFGVSPTDVKKSA